MKYFLKDTKEEIKIGDYVLSETEYTDDNSEYYSQKLITVDDAWLANAVQNGIVYTEDGNKTEKAEKVYKTSYRDFYIKLYNNIIEYIGRKIRKDKNSVTNLLSDLAAVNDDIVYRTMIGFAYDYFSKDQKYDSDGFWIVTIGKKGYQVSPVDKKVKGHFVFSNFNHACEVVNLINLLKSESEGSEKAK